MSAAAKGVWGVRAWLALCGGALGIGVDGGVPDDYAGRPFEDAAQSIPGRVELSRYDWGGEGVAYHDSDAVNNGSGRLNREELHRRPGVPDSIAHFRSEEGVDLSFAKDFADFNHPNLWDPPDRQLYIGWQESGEWANYTVEVERPGRYRVVALYGRRDNGSTLLLNGVEASRLRLPVDTGDWHYWNRATVGEIALPEKGPQLLTLRYNAGANLAYLDFEWIAE